MQEVIITITTILLKHCIDPYNTKLILLCLKQTQTQTQTQTLTLTLTLEPVTPTGARAKEALVAQFVAVAETIAETVKLLGIDLKDK